MRASPLRQTSPKTT